MPGMQLFQAQAHIPTISKGGSMYTEVLWLPVKRLRALEGGQDLEALWALRLSLVVQPCLEGSHCVGLTPCG